MATRRSSRSGELHELGLRAAARAMRNGEVSSEVYVGTLLERARRHADLQAFITIDAAAVLEAARHADRALRAGRRAPLLGVPLAVKDSYLTKGLTTTLGTSVLATFMPTRDAVAVAGVKEAGTRIEPTVSPPSAAGMRRAATAAPAPLEEPPVTWAWW